MVVNLLGVPSAKLEELRAIPVEKFASSRESSRSLGSPVDGRLKTKATRDAFQDGTANYVPLLIGSNSGGGPSSGAPRGSMAPN
jgi:hypothetical protein